MLSDGGQIAFGFVGVQGEGNGNPLQYSCLENPRDGEAWWAAIYGVAQSRTRLKRLSSSSSSKDPTKRQSLQAETPGRQRQGAPGFLQLRRKGKASMPHLPLLLLLLRGLGSHGFPATSDTQEQNTEMVQVDG